MTEPTAKSFETNNQTPDFQKQIDSITDRTLTPENIDSYADEALDDLVDVVHDVVTLYDRQPTVGYESGGAHERAAFSYYGLDANYVETTLDYIADKAQDIENLDKIIDQIIRQSGEIIIPPSHKEVAIAPGDGSFEVGQSVPRLKTLLFILQNSFGVDIKDSDQCKITTGVLGDSMMRTKSYQLVELPTLSRAVFICDETKNATFILDIARLEDVAIPVGTLAAMTKDELRDLFSMYPGIGKKLKYTERFVENVDALLREVPAEGNKTKISSHAAKMLKVPRESAPQGYLTTEEIAELSGLSYKTLRRIVRSLEIEGSEYRIGPNSKQTAFYSPTEQAMINEEIERRKVPDGWRNIFQIATAAGVQNHKIVKLINEITEHSALESIVRLGPGGETDFYSPTAQEQIVAELGEVAPEGWLSEQKTARLLKAVVPTLNLAAGTIGITPKEYRSASSGGVLAPHYSPEDIEKLRETIGEAAPDGWKTRSMLITMLGGSAKTWQEKIIPLARERGVVGQEFKLKKAKVGKILYYSPEEQEIIEQCAHEIIVKKPRTTRTLGATALK